MDELVFRSSQKLENLQVQLSLAGDQGRALAQQLSFHARNALVHIRGNAVSIHLEETVKQLWQYFIECSGRLKEILIIRLHSLHVYENVKRLILQKWTKDNVYFGFIGFFLGALCGIGIGILLCKRHKVLRYMRAIQCNSFIGVEAATVVEDAIGPHQCGPNDVLINVKAASVNIIDTQICNGYGHRIRSILMNHVFTSYQPVTLGRACTGVITDVGKNVRRLEVGDEVFVGIPFWATGSLSQSVLVHQNLVAHKPKNTGYEAACSLPYSGTIALNTLKKCKLNAKDCNNKRVLIIGGCTPVGCILIQLLKLWKAHVCTTSFKKAKPVCVALGAHDVICLQNNDEVDGYSKDIVDTLFIELEQRERYDVIIVTKDLEVTIDELEKFCVERKCVVTTVPPVHYSDSFGYTLSFLFWVMVNSKSFLKKIFGGKPETFGEAHMCYISLEKLKELVENGQLQTVVDKVYHPTDIEIALKHIQSWDSIGSTIITFR